MPKARQRTTSAERRAKERPVIRENIQSSIEAARIRLNGQSGRPVSAAQALKCDWTAARSLRFFGGASAAPQRLSAAVTDPVRMKVSLPTMRRKLGPELPPI